RGGTGTAGRGEGEARSPADRGGDQAADQRARRGADPTQRADDSEGSSARGDLGEEQRSQDVDRRDQQRGTDTFEDGVAEDQDPQPGRGGAHQSPDAVYG